MTAITQSKTLYDSPQEQQHKDRGSRGTRAAEARPQGPQAHVGPGSSGVGRAALRAQHPPHRRGGRKHRGAGGKELLKPVRRGPARRFQAATGVHKGGCCPPPPSLTAAQEKPRDSP